MARWKDFVVEAPELAAWVGMRFKQGRHCLLATVRKNGAPRISAIELDFHPDELEMGCLAGTAKVLDLRREPRVALHCATGFEGGPDWIGDAKIVGVAHEVPEGQDGHPLFRIDLTEVSTVRPDESGEYVMYDVWRPGAGSRRTN